MQAAFDKRRKRQRFNAVLKPRAEWLAKRKAENKE
jgi:hypothetical protein